MSKEGVARDEYVANILEIAKRADCFPETAEVAIRIADSYYMRQSRTNCTDAACLNLAIKTRETNRKMPTLTELRRLARASFSNLEFFALELQVLKEVEYRTHQRTLFQILQGILSSGVTFADDQLRKEDPIQSAKTAPEEEGRSQMVSELDDLIARCRKMLHRKQARPALLKSKVEQGIMEQYGRALRSSLFTQFQGIDLAAGIVETTRRRYLQGSPWNPRLQQLTGLTFEQADLMANRIEGQC